MSNLPIRVRLTIWYFAMFASAAVLLCLASLWMLKRSVDETEYQDLKERAEDVQLLLSHEDPARTALQISDEFTEIYNLKDDGKYLQVRDEQGNWIYRSKRMVAQNPSLPAPSLLPPAGALSEFHQGTRFVRVLAYPIRAKGQRYSVQTGISLNKSMVLLTRFSTNLLLLTPIVILLAAAGGHFMSRKALRPVAALAAEARRINDRNLDIRLPVPNANDEISDLSRTLNQMLERIDQAFGTVRAFTGNASHELRTPIALLRTEIEVALFRHRDGEQYRETLKRLHQETIRMTCLVENLLSIARSEAGAETMSLQPVSVSDLFQSLSRDWKTMMHLARLDFQTEIGEAHDLFILGDAAGVARLLTILLENARNYTPPGGRVVLSATSLGSSVRLAVSDSGIGIAPEHLPRIFDRFYRAGQAGDQNSRGSGLGLALAKWIAERHGAQLTVQSELGRGTLFSFSLACSTPQLNEVTALAELRA